MKTCIILFLIALILGVYALARIATVSGRRAANIVIKREENSH